MTNPTTPPLVETIGDLDSPIWLLGDSPSAKNLHLKPTDKNHLKPLDPRHPSRHTIWTPILDVIQRRLFDKCGHRLDDRELFIRNAVSDPKHKLEKPEKLGAKIVEFRKKQVDEIKELRELLNRQNKPFLVLCFGQFAYACALRTQQDLIEELRPQEWKKSGILKLSKVFEARIGEVQLGKVTLLPLLHASAARSFQSATEHFSGKPSGKRPNYFEYAGEKIAEVLIANRTDPRLDKLMLRGKQEDTASE